MKVLLLNASPRRNGNTAYAIKNIVEAISEDCSSTTEVIDVTSLTVSGCIACDGCKTNNGDCVIKDDSKYIIDKISSADIVIFASPVYWWGIPSQLKAVIDKFYSAQKRFPTQNKKIAVIAIGADAIDSKQYSLISDQFSCICDFLGWDKIFNLSFSALNTDDLQKSEEASIELLNVWKKYFSNNN